MPEPGVGSEWDEQYDKENDVYYVSFGTGEPSYCVEVDDMLVVDVGFFSHVPTGYRILNKSKVQAQRLPNQAVKDLLSKVLRNLPAAPTMNDREADVTRSLEKVLS